MTACSSAAADTTPRPVREVLPAQVDLYCPFPLSTYPGDVAGIDEHAVRWCLQRQLFDAGSTAARMGCAYGIAHALPLAPESTIAVAARHFFWGSAFDDYCDGRPDPGGLAALVGELHRVMYAAPGAPLPAGNRWIESLHDLRGDVEKVLTDDEFAAFTHAHAVWLNGQMWFTSLQQRTSPLTVAEWLRARWVKSGVATLVPFTGATSGVHALARQHSREPVVRAFTEAVMMAAALLNDLASAAKEILGGTGVTNLMAVLAPPGADAIDPTAAVQLYERVVAVAYRLQQQLLADPRPDVARYARELPRWIPAGIEWASHTARYLEAPGAGPAEFVPPQICVSTTPTAWDPDDLTPPPHPEIAWWWKELR